MTDVATIPLRNIHALSRTTVGALERSGIFFVEDVARYSAEMLRLVPGIGDKSIANIRTCLAQLGVKLEGE